MFIKNNKKKMSKNLMKNIFKMKNLQMIKIKKLIMN